MNVKHISVIGKLIGAFMGVLIGALILLSLNCRYFYGCGRGCHNPEKKAEYFSKRIKSKLDLDEKQAKLVDQFKKEYLTKKKAFHAEHAEDHGSFSKEIRKEKPDANVIRSIMGQKAKHRADMREFMLTRLMSLHSVLRPEQRGKLADFIEKKMQRKRCHKH